MDVDQILPELFLGAHPRSPDDIDELQRRFGITAVLNVQTQDDFDHWGVDWDGLSAHYARLGIEVRRLPVRDFDPQDLRDKLPACVGELQELLDAKHRVYVHCNVGVGRSPSVVTAYLHWVQGWDLPQAAEYVKSRRICDPNVEAIRLASKDRRG